MKIALVQPKVTVDKETNLSKGLKALKEAAGIGAEVVCFSELAFEPFYPQEKAQSNVLDFAETIPGPTTEAFASLAEQLNVVVILNLFEKEGDYTMILPRLLIIKVTLLVKLEWFIFQITNVFMKEATITLGILVHPFMLLSLVKLVLLYVMTDITRNI